MLVPTTPYIPSKDPPIKRHETEYMPVPPSPTSGWEFAPILDWVRGPIPGQASFQTLGWVPGSSTRQADSSSGLVASDGANDISARCFADYNVKDDDFL